MRLFAMLGVAMLGLFLMGNGPAAAAVEAAPAAGAFFVYLGTYTGQKSKGIYRCRFDAATGRLSAPELAAETQNPTWLDIHPRLPALYSAGRPLLLAANEVGGGGREGSVSAYAIDRAGGKLTLINRQSSRGSGPCHLSIDPSGRCALVANYGSGSIAALPVDADGSLREASAFVQHSGSSVNKSRQQGPHAHWIDVVPGSRFVFTCDLGLDKVLVYELDAAAGSLKARDPAWVSLKPGAGPRHLAFHPTGRFAYVINEMGNSVAVFALEPERGALRELQTVPTLPEGFAGQSSTAEIQAHPSGRFLYGSNRGHDSIVVFAIDSKTGLLSAVQHEPTRGRTPRNFAIDPTGRWLLAANQGTDSVAVFRIDPQTGRLAPTGEKQDVGAPVCVQFFPAP